MDSVQASLERLQTDHIDLYQIHGTDGVTPIDETLRALDDLQRQGMVRYFGVSNWTAWRIAKALGVSEAKGWGRFETLQAYYSIAGRDLERAAHDGVDLVLLQFADHLPEAGVFVAAEGHGPERDLGHEQAGAAQLLVLHGRTPGIVGIAGTRARFRIPANAI
jgi:hypothetical protein